MGSSLLGADQTWDAFGLCVVCSLIIVSGFYWLTRSGRRSYSPGLLLGACAVCVIIVGFGFVLQPLLWELVVAPSPEIGSIYFIEYQPMRAVRNLALAWATGGIIPGTLLGILLVHARVGKSYVGAGISGFLVLAVYDIAQLALVAKPVPADLALFREINLLTGLKNLWFSLVCDLIGGFMTGMICRSAIGGILAVTVTDDPAVLRLTLQRLLCSCFAAATLILGGYFLLFHPRDADVVLQVQDYHSRSVTFAQTATESIAVLHPNAGTVLDRIANNSVIGFPAPSLHVISVGFSQNLQLSQMIPGANPGLTLGFHGNGHGDPLAALLFGTLDCDSPEAAVGAVEHSDVEGTALNLDGQAGSLFGFVQELEVVAGDGPMPNAALYIPHGQVFIQTRGALPVSHWTFSSPFATLEIPARKGKPLCPNQWCEDNTNAVGES